MYRYLTYREYWCSPFLFFPFFPGKFNFFCVFFSFLAFSLLYIQLFLLLTMHLILRKLIQTYNDNNINNKMIIQLNKYQIKLTTNLLTNNHINIKILNNKILILNNYYNINIIKLLNKHYINYSLI